MSIAIVGLADFLSKAGLDEKRYGGEARRFCAEQGAINVCEVLEDDELLQSFVEHLQLKRLEQRRCETAASDFRAGRWSPEGKAEDSGSTAGYQPPKATPTAINSTGRTQEQQISRGSTSANDGRADRLFRSGTGWRGRGANRLGKGGRVAATTQARSHYFDQAEEVEEECNPGGGHYFESRQTAPKAGEQHYFREPELVQAKAKPTKAPLFCGSCGSAYSGSEKFCQQCGVPRCTDARVEVTTSQHPSLTHGSRNHAASTSERNAPNNHYFVEDPAEMESSPSRFPRQGNERSRANPLASSQRADQSGPQSRPQRPKEVPKREVLEPPRESVLSALEEKKRQEEEAKGAKREAARQRRRQQDAERAFEYRIDPDDGKAYTLDEFRAHHAGTFSQAEIDKYWNNECHLQAKEAPRQQQTEQRRMKEVPSQQQAEQRRIDPEDGCPYTLEEMLQRHARRFSEAEIRAYWRDECTEISSRAERW